MRTQHTPKHLAVIALLATAAAASPEIPWSSIDGGVQTMTGAAYILTGTVGQHDATPSHSAAGTYTLRGGFWQPPIVATDGGCNPADIAEPFGTLDLADIAAFVSGFTTMDPAADLDENGVFDLNDIGAFVGAFTAGCP